MAEEIQQMQDDEREALASIYEGDVAFKQTDPKTFQYKVNVCPAYILCSPACECLVLQII